MSHQSSSIDCEMPQQQQKQQMMMSGFDGYVRIHRRSGKLAAPILQAGSPLEQGDYYASFETAWHQYCRKNNQQRCFFFFFSPSSLDDISETFQKFLQSKATSSMMEKYHVEYRSNPESSSSFDYIFFMRSSTSSSSCNKNGSVVGPVAIDSDLLTTLRLVVVDAEAEPWQRVFNDLQGLVTFQRCAVWMCGLFRVIFVLVATMGYYKLFSSFPVVVVDESSFRLLLVQQVVPYTIMVWAALMFLETFQSKVKEGFSFFVKERLMKLYQQHNIQIDASPLLLSSSSKKNRQHQVVEILNVSCLGREHHRHQYLQVV